MSKNRIIVEAVLAGQSQTRVSQLMALWRKEGWQGLEHLSRKPHTNPRATAAHIVDRIVELRQQLTTQGCDNGAHTIAIYLQREHLTAPHESTIWRILSRHGLITPQPRKRPRHSYIRFEADLPNQCWQADFTHWPLANGTDTNILLFIDDHSRFIISATAHHRVTGTIVLDTFRTAITNHGTPQSTLTDNGFVFTTRHRNGPNSFEVELLTLGIEQKNGTPNHPQTQGKVERLNQTLKRWLHAQQRASTIQNLQTQLDEFTIYYNTQRPHRSRNGATPQQAYIAREKATPQHNTHGHWRIREDKVGKNGKVTLRRGGKYHHIGLGTEHAGTPIKMLINNLDVTVIDTHTGEILRQLTINPDTKYQPRGIKPGPKPGTPRQGGIPKGYKFKK